MPIVELPNKATPDLIDDDPYLPAAIENIRKAVLDLQRRGIIDAEGRRIRTDLPPDMEEGSDRDFGG